jgi:hypothetical protein
VVADWTDAEKLEIEKFTSKYSGQEWLRRV